jgi:hypothetical protein
MRASLGIPTALKGAGAEPHVDICPQVVVHACRQRERRDDRVKAFAHQPGHMCTGLIFAHRLMCTGLIFAHRLMCTGLIFAHRLMCTG